jgi:hypothetical protein
LIQREEPFLLSLLASDEKSDFEKKKNFWAIPTCPLLLAVIVQVKHSQY